MSILPHDWVALSNPSPIEIEKKKSKTLRQQFLAQRPGSLTSQGTLQIKTRAAQQHFLSLLTFAKRVKLIYRAAQKDDPYADASLLKIEQALETIQTFLQEKTTFYQQLMPPHSGLFIPLVDTEKPLCLPVQFRTPYAHMAARALVEFDTLVRCVISLYQWGLLADMSLTIVLRQLSRPLHNVWKAAKIWQPTGLTRAAFLQSTFLADEGASTRKKLDPRVLNKELRAKYAPPIITTKPKKMQTIQTAPTKDFSTSTSLT